MAKSPETVSLDQLDKDQMKTFSDFLMSYNKLSEMCFTDCVRDFTSRDVKDSEEKCSLNCMEKYLKMNQRVSQRFQEFQMIANENALAMAQKTNKL
ncbi:mitochondrial import inner membrane translocase subunit Tim9 [Drosophila novamexicana]|uniref:Mitochondrial import inner membrane translocase subunit n=5 Tax=Drosophila TaxID=32281 RepID=B4L1S4_DROMO|nr:mitochondrial import inner membrane translocase subunit Tim9 [Drosophila mojavensis]XP_002059533.1 mitochondrial import inner membrane translocase subunit Tim9 [Drosophila virilis]XP_017869676.1 PREDICTED: mitochondrial import inner membrane translocase subunit Tim9 [Drosophila arizonae]XP_017963940.1 mitochondrial import inner membrane translocase subunit Tim9 [Drosophila navojoa]XP_023167096.1 mitochondrial import inner membrane translocase subunit Tim9 [Drosophila hydei]XP_030569355.1 mi